MSIVQRYSIKIYQKWHWSLIHVFKLQFSLEECLQVSVHHFTIFTKFIILDLRLFLLYSIACLISWNFKGVNSSSNILSIRDAWSLTILESLSSRFRIILVWSLSNNRFRKFDFIRNILLLIGRNSNCTLQQPNLRSYPLSHTPLIPV